MGSKKSSSLNSIIFFIGLFIMALTITTISSQQTSKFTFTQISVISLVIGVVFESGRLSSSWSEFVENTSLPILGSSFFLIPFGKEPYNLEGHLYTWCIFFIFLFVISSIVTHDQKVLPRLSEGVTLMQSIAIIYWVIDLHYYETNDELVRGLMAVGVTFSLFAFFNAFTHIALTELSRLILSLWSSIIMVLFAADYLYRIYNNEQSNLPITLNAEIYTCLQYFLLGVSSIYMAHNFYMLFGLFPGKGWGWSNIVGVLDKHIKRYSDRQVNISHSLLCTVFVGTVFYLNYHYRILPRHVAIWLVFTIFPLILRIFDHAKQKTSR